MGKTGSKEGKKMLPHSHFANRRLFLPFHRFAVPLAAVKNCELMPEWGLYNASVRLPMLCLRSHGCQRRRRGGLPSNGISRGRTPLGSKRPWWENTFFAQGPWKTFEPFHRNFARDKTGILTEFQSTVPGSPSDLNTGNGTEGAMVCTILGSLLRPLFYFLCSKLKANPVQTCRNRRRLGCVNSPPRPEGGGIHAT